MSLSVAIKTIHLQIDNMQYRSVSVIIIMLLCFCFDKGYSQKEEAVEKFAPHSSIGIVLGHAHVFEGRDAEGHKKVLSLPSWGVDYNYQFHPKWAIGFHTDIILETFSVEKHLESGGNGEVIERSTPVAPAIMGIYKPCTHWNFLFGAGAEFAREGNFFLNRLGVEYGAEIRNGWEVSGSLGYDFKWNAYDTWVLGIGISKAFGGNKKEGLAKQE